MKTIKHIRNQLGESPLWHSQKKRFYWVDITQKFIHALTSDSKKLETITLPDKVGCIVVADNGNLVAALAREIVEICLTTHKIRPLCKPNLPKDVMFNDGKVDCMGRFWLGTKDISEEKPIAALYRFDEQGLTLKQDEVIISNGLDWNLDNTVMYFTDSPRQEIYQYDFDSQSGAIKNKRVFTKVSTGFPDGLTVDNEGHIWGAHWEGSCVTRYDPHGNIKKVIATEAKRPTSCCFGGEGYKQLYITSASIGIDTFSEKKDGFLFLDDSLAVGKPSFLFKMAGR